MIFKDYYKILGLETNKVDFEDIKVAFREQAKKYHPDVNKGNARSEERFKDINEAYKILSTPSTKRKYDRQWNTYIKNKKDKDKKEQVAFDNIFGIFFGAKNKEVKEVKEKTNKKLAIKGENIDTEIDIKLEEAFYGLEKQIALRTVNRKNENIHCKSPRRDIRWRKN